jgi:hypothetical protein
MKTCPIFLNLLHPTCSNCQWEAVNYISPCVVKKKITIGNSCIHQGAKYWGYPHSWGTGECFSLILFMDVLNEFTFFEWRRCKT